MGGFWGTPVCTGSLAQGLAALAPITMLPNLSWALFGWPHRIEQNVSNVPLFSILAYASHERGPTQEEQAEGRSFVPVPGRAEMLDLRWVKPELLLCLL